MMLLPAKARWSLRWPNTVIGVFNLNSVRNRFACGSGRQPSATAFSGSSERRRQRVEIGQRAPAFDQDGQIDARSVSADFGQARISASAQNGTHSAAHSAKRMLIPPMRRGR